jgi:chorismate-pyruvate lyase
MSSHSAPVPAGVTEPLDGTAQRHAWSSLLERFYVRAGLPTPRLERLQAGDVPGPYHGLLVHSSDMTPTLERFYQQRLGLTVLSRERKGDLYYREVVLHLAEDRQPVEYGVIRIYLDHLPPNAREAVVQERSPFGDILRRESIAHLGWPQAYFRLESDLRIGMVLGLIEPTDLFGRRNVLLDEQRRLLAEVIEVLAPIPCQSEN